MPFIIANFRHVADGLQEGQFALGERKRAASVADLDPIYRQLLDRPITQTLGIIGPDGRPSLTPMWFDYEDDNILVNTASHRAKCEWIRKNPRMTSLLVNPENPYHWVQIRHTVAKELREREPGGEYVTNQPTGSGPSTPAVRRLTACATRRSTRGGSCSSAASTGSLHSGSPNRKDLRGSDAETRPWLKRSSCAARMQSPIRGWATPA